MVKYVYSNIDSFNVILISNYMLAIGMKIFYPTWHLLFANRALPVSQHDDKSSGNICP